MQIIGPALDIPTSLSAVFDSSDEDELAASEDPALHQEFKDPAQTRGSVATFTAAAIVNPELHRLADEYREAGLSLLDCSPVEALDGQEQQRYCCPTEGDHLHEQLASLGLSTAVLSPAAANSLQSIAAVAQELRLQGCQENMVLLSITQLRLEECQLACAQHDSQELAAWLACHQHAALKQLRKLRSALESAQNTASATADHVQRHQTNIGMLAQKEQQYTLQLQTLEDKLTTAKYSPLLRHNAIMQRQAQYDKQTKLVTEKESRLAQFLDLPPDMTAAKAVYDHKWRALLAARRQLEEGLAGL